MPELIPELQLDKKRVIAGETIQVRLKEVSCSVAELQLKMINSYGEFPEEGPAWQLTHAGEFFTATIRIPNKPLHNPDGGEYRLCVVNQKNEVIASTQIYITHWSQDHYYGPLELLPKPQRCFYQGEMVAVPQLAPLFSVHDENGQRAVSIEKFLSNHLRLPVAVDSEKPASIRLLINPLKSQRWGDDWASNQQTELQASTESYTLVCDFSGQLCIELCANDDAGLYQGLRTLAQLVKHSGESYVLPDVRILDWPNFKYRGIVEGFYGEPWSQPTRLNVLERLARLKHNMYFYGPKGDLYHREKWGEPYDAESLVKLDYLYQYCCDLKLNFVYSIAPGLSIRYNNASDRNKLLEKVQSVVALGIRQVAILFDDIDEELQHPQDIQQYGHPAAAQVDISNWLLNQLDASVTLVFCPTEYYQQSDSLYRQALREGLDPAIDVIWTGTGIFSPSIPLGNAQRHQKLFGRKLWLWDNFPVNDADKSMLIMGPLSNRATDLSTACDTLLSNPMPQANLSCISLGTCADYAWNSLGYDANSSWQLSIKKFSANPAYKRLALACSGSRIHTPVHQAFFSLWHDYKASRSAVSCSALLEEITKDTVAIGELFSENDASILDELRPFLLSWQAQLTLLAALLKGELTSVSSNKRQQLDTEQGCPYDGLLLDIIDFCIVQLSAKGQSVEAVMPEVNHK